MLLFAATLGLGSCDDIQDLNLNFGDRTYINDYKGLIDAVNNLNLTLKERMDALSQLLKEGLTDIKVSIDANTGAITIVGQNIATLDGDMKDGLSTINTTLFNGFQAVCTQIDATGNTIVAAIDNNGNLLRLQIDSTGKLLSAQMITSTEDLIKVLKENNASLAEKLGLIDAAIQAGFANSAKGQEDIKKAITEAIAALAAEVKAGNKSNADALAEIKNAISSQTTDLSTKITVLTSAVTTGLATENNTIASMSSAIQTAINDLKNEVKNGNTSNATYLAQLVSGLTALNTTMGTTNTQLGNIKDVLTKELADSGVTINPDGDGKSVLVTPDIWSDIEKAGATSQLYNTFMDAIKDITVPKVVNPTQVTPGTWHSCADFVNDGYDANSVHLRAGTLQPMTAANGKTVIKVIKTPDEVKFHIDGLNGCTYPYIYNIRVFDARGDYQIYGGASGNVTGSRADIGESQSADVPTSQVRTANIILKAYYNGRICDEVKAYVFTYQNTSTLPALFWPSTPASRP